MSDYPRIVLTGKVPKGAWRVVEDEREDANGVLRPFRIVEMTEDSKVDAMGQQIWERLTLQKSGLSQWVMLTESLLDLILQELK